MFFIEDSGIAYRIDEEEFGCSIRSYNLYIEGNETVYIILERMYTLSQKNKSENLIEELVDVYDTDKEEIIEVLEDCITIFIENNILQETRVLLQELIDKNR